MAPDQRACNDVLGVQPSIQATAFLMSARILASVVSASDVRVHATGCLHISARKTRR